MDRETGIIFDELYLGSGEMSVLIGDKVNRYIGNITLRIVKKTGHLFSVSIKRPKEKPREFNARHVICWTV